MKLKKLFALALAVCMMALAVPAAFAASLTLDYGTTPTTPAVEEQTPVVYNTRTTSRTSNNTNSGTATFATREDAYVPSGNGASHTSVETVKTVTKNGNKYDVHLEAWVTGKITETKGTQPMDIVLVIDQSKSMLDAMGSGTRQNAMKTAVESFITEVAGTANAEISDHRIAIVTFDDNATQVIGWTDVLTGAGTLTTTVNGLSVTNDSPSTTNIAAGMSGANALMTTGYSYNGENKAERKKVVILLTDGVPTVEDNLRFNVDAADAALSIADGMKENEILVYSIGIFADAMPNQLHGVSWDHVLDWTNPTTCSDTSGSKWGEWWATDIGGYVFAERGDVYEVDIPAGNRFLNYISSNYRTASVNLKLADYEYDYGISKSGAVGWEITANALTPVGNSHYLAADNVEGLKLMFKTITTSASKVDIDLDENTILQDVVTKYFEIVGSPTAYALNLSNDEKTALTAEKNGNTVSVTGFDYSEETHFVPQTGTSGQKVVVDFVIAPREGFLGGTGVYTNDVLNSGMISEDTFVENFDPKQVIVDVPQLKIEGAAKNVYLNSTLTEEEKATLTEGAQLYIVYSEEKKVAVDLTSWQAAYVDVTYAAGTVDTVNGTTYGLTCSVKSKGTSTELGTGSGTGTLNIYKPVLTYADKTIYLSETVTAEEQLQSTEWKCGDVTANDSVLGTNVISISYGAINATTCGSASISTITVNGSDPAGHITFMNGGVAKTKDTIFMVHVVEPTIVPSETDIPMGSEAPLNESFYGITWNAKCIDGANDKPNRTISLAVNYYLNGTKVTADYPLECKEYIKKAVIAGEENNNFTSTLKVHVYAPEIIGENTTIYLGKSTTLDANDVTLTWSKQCVSHTRKETPDAVLNQVYAFNQTTGPVTVDPNACTNYDVVLTKLGEVTFKNSPYTTSLIVHVVAPVVEFQNSTIYLGHVPAADNSEFELLNIKKDPADTTQHLITWTHTKPDGDYQETGPKPAVTFGFEPQLTEDNRNYQNCVPVNATVYSDEKTSHTGNFIVHVLKPTVTFQDSEIFLSEKADYAEDNVVLTADGKQATWDCQCVENKGSTTEDPPELTYTYQPEEGFFETCQPVDVTVFAKFTSDVNITSGVTFKNGSEDRTASEEKFKVHVYRPNIVLTSQPLWNNYDATADYAQLAQGVATVAIDKWTDQCGAKAEKKADSTTIGVSEPKYTFTLGDETITEYMAKAYKTTDKDTITATLTEIKVGAGTYEVAKLPAVAPVNFDIHVNKFELTINTDWTKSDGEEQGSIFTVSPVNQEDKNLKPITVAIPKGESSVVITGLFSGQEYTIAEDNGWTWRYGTAADAVYGENETDISCAGGFSLEDLAEKDSVKMSFDDGETYNAKWLADEDCVINKATTQATTINPTLSVKKKDEEVTNV